MQIIPASLAIKAMRDSGYRDSAHALAELIDNSIQAEANRVEVLCLDKVEVVNQRSRRKVDRIAVYDNGQGMTPTTLRMALQFGNGTRLNTENQVGIGKFGMGLPNSSISQCQKVEVWSWREGQVSYTYLDIDEIREGVLVDVPVPVSSTLPEDIIAKLTQPIGPSGTLVLWSRLDRVRWKSSKALLQNAEFLVGRMYRYFIDEGSTTIRLAAFSKASSGGWTIDYDTNARPNDPLYLMRDTSCPDLPEPFEGEAMFDEFEEPMAIDVKLPGDPHVHQVTLRFSLVRSSVRKTLNTLHTNAGSSSQGKHAKNNIGISLVRARRELEMSQAHVSGHNPVERWWGAEVSFEPALDAIFGVTNNKQSATAFAIMNMDDDAAEHGMSKEEYRDMLLESEDPRLAMYEISQQIHRNLSSIRKQLDRMTDGQRKRAFDAPQADPAEEAATRATRHRMNEGFEGNSDREEDRPPEQKTTELAQELTDLGIDPEEAKQIAVSHVEAGLKYVFQQQPYDGASFFSVSSKGGSIIITVNKRHPVAPNLIGLLENSEGAVSDKALMALKLMLCAWARLEDETQNPAMRQRYVDFRDSWGRLTRDFLGAAYEE
jgi:hypothetical protein